MRLKEIKPGMVIHCKTNDESKALYDELCRIGNMKTDTVTDSFDNFKDADCCYRIEDLKHETWSFATGPATVEFSDLIIPDQELSAEETLLAYDQMCKEHYCCNDCPIYGILGHECAHKMDGHITEIVDVIKKWKADREKKGPETEKKEPEIEWVFKCVADAVGLNKIEFFASEESAREWCERRTLETGTNHAYVPVCRVKAAE